MPSKYEPLRKYLLNSEEDSIQLSFDEVEEIVGELPSSSRQHQAWWSNNESHTNAKNGWLAAGWMSSKVDMVHQNLTFTRTQTDLRLSQAQSKHKLVTIMKAVGGVDNLSEIMTTISEYIHGDIVETELGRRLRQIWPR
jgi:hypothetical protein